MTNSASRSTITVVEKRSESQTLQWLEKMARFATGDSLNIIFQNMPQLFHVIHFILLANHEDDKENKYISWTC